MDGISFPNGCGLTPPPGLLEPVGRLGFVWFEKLGGPSSQLGWANGPEKGICVALQPFAAGTILATNKDIESCDNGNFNRAREPDFTPVVIALKDDGSWWKR